MRTEITDFEVMKERNTNMSCSPFRFRMIKTTTANRSSRTPLTTPRIIPIYDFAFAVTKISSYLIQN